MRAANCATTSATSVCPTAAMIHSQIPTGPAVTQYVVVGREDADRHRDERERDREDLKGAERSFQFRFVAAFATLLVGNIDSLFNGRPLNGGRSAEVAVRRSIGTGPSSHVIGE